MSGRVNPKEITSWLNLSKYHQFMEFSVIEVLQELEGRCQLLIDWDEKECDGFPLFEYRQTMLEGLKQGLVTGSQLSSFYVNIDEDSPTSLSEDEEAIDTIEVYVNGCPIISENHFSSYPREGHLSKGEAISPFSMGDLTSYYRSFVRQEYIKHDDWVASIANGEVFSSVNMVDYLGDNFSNELIIKLNIEEYTDDELLSEFKELLKSWRIETGYDEPEAERSRVGLATLKKIFSYKVIPFLDLILWEKVNNKKISNELLARLLFPMSDGDIVGGNQIKDTIKPFIDRLINGGLQRQMDFYIKKNDYLKTMRFSDVMKLSELS